MSGILSRPIPRHKVKPEERQILLDRTKDVLQGRVQEAYVFGSFLTKEFNDQSDLDLILVLETNTPFIDRAKDFLDLLELPNPIDLLVYTPEEFQKLISDPTLGFWVSVKETLHRFL